MDYKKKIPYLILFLFLVLFPFGQLPGFSLKIFGQIIRFKLLDVVAILSLIYLPLSVSAKKTFSKLSALETGYFLIFFLVLSSIYPLGFDPLGLLYLVRILAYLSLVFVAADVAKKSGKEYLVNSLFVSIAFSAVFGWIQYFMYPDLTTLRYIGWDDHLNRLTGTFLDPGFTSIIIVLGSFISINKYLESKNKSWLLMILFMAMTLMFTYSRAGYLAFIVGILYLLRKESKKIAGLVIVLFLAFLLILPRSEGEGVKLERTMSISLRLDDYKTSLNIIKSSPLFGIGFNNICNYKLNENLVDEETLPHSCWGLSSSILFILSTVGIVGLLLLLGLTIKFWNKISGRYERFLKVCLLSLLVHSQFNHSLFYPWILGSMAILTGVVISKSEG